MKRKSYKRGERQSQILDQFYKLVDGGKRPELTVYQLAKLLDMTPSPHLRGIVWELVHEGLLDSRSIKHRSNSEKTIFFLPPSQYSFPKQTERMIAVNGQLTLFGTNNQTNGEN